MSSEASWRTCSMEAKPPEFTATTSSQTPTGPHVRRNDLMQGRLADADGLNSGGRLVRGVASQV